MPQATVAYLQRAFRHFAEICADSSPLYAALSSRVADEPAVLELASRRTERQPPVNLLFGAVHFLLLGGVEHPLAGYYPSVGGGEAADGAWPVFADFCARFRGEIVREVARRRVQTNEVGRCGLLMPAFEAAHRACGGPLHLVEVGASAGLNLLFDRYRYEYDAGPHAPGPTCGGDSPVVVRTKLIGPGTLPIPDAPPPVAGRVGADVAPVNVTDDDAMRWVEALIWPDQLDRIALYRCARALARTDPPRLVAGDGLELVEALVGEASPASVPCVFHSHAACQMNEGWRAAFDDRLGALGRGRDLAYVSLEWLGDDPGPQLHLTVWRKAARSTRHLAACDHHGRWLRPVTHH